MASQSNLRALIHYHNKNAIHKITHQLKLTQPAVFIDSILLKTTRIHFKYLLI